jgi:peptidylprolyl isomerase
VSSQPQRQRPEIDFPEGPPPQDLQIVDEVVGEGTEAQAGMTVRAHYVGVAYSTGEEFDASWNRGQPLDFRLGVGQVIAGWDQGIQGMRVGGRRKLTIPARLAYGDRGAGGAIAPGETLIFVVDLVDAR